MKIFTLKMATPCIKRYGQKYDFLSEIAPLPLLLDRKIKLGLKFFHDYLSSDYRGIALSISKVSIRSGCYTWKTSLVSAEIDFCLV